MQDSTFTWLLAPLLGLWPCQ